VQAVMALDLVGDFLVALAASEGGRTSGYQVALGTVCGAIQALVSAG
jgi:hypothetical protein